MTIPTVIKGERTGRDFFMKRSSYQFDSLQLSCPTPFPFHSAIHLLGHESHSQEKGNNVATAICTTDYSIYKNNWKKTRQFIPVEFFLLESTGLGSNEDE
jgi:hypothetical protein